MIAIRVPSQAADPHQLETAWILVHHGGAGTTGAGLRSGVPSVLTPLAADQPSWARQIYALGAGPAPLPFQTLTAERLAGAIREAVTNPAIRQRAAELGRQIQAEDGLGQTIELFLQYVARFGRGGGKEVT
jgi:sterol 3beta-glucosyltransferase